MRVIDGSRVPPPLVTVARLNNLDGKKHGAPGSVQPETTRTAPSVQLHHRVIHRGRKRLFPVSLHCETAAQRLVTPSEFEPFGLIMFAKSRRAI